MNTLKPFIKLEDVWFEYHQEEQVAITVLEQINLTIQQGEFIVILGHNGSGKSTLAKHLNGLLTPTKGRVWVDGIQTTEQDRLLEIRQQVGMVFQNPDNQLVATTVEEDVAFAPENLGVDSEHIGKRVEEVLRVVGMQEYAQHAPHQLSGGQKQRVAIAGVLAMCSSCIVLDEPTAMLDPKGRQEVMTTIRRLNSEQGITIILITHDMTEAVMASRVIVMDHGKVVMDDAPREIFPQLDRLSQYGLEGPQVTQLCDRLRKRGIAVSRQVLFEDECVAVLHDLWKDQSHHLQDDKDGYEWGRQ